MLAGFAGAEVDRFAETKGMNEYEYVQHCCCSVLLLTLDKLAVREPSIKPDRTPTICLSLSCRKPSETSMADNISRYDQHYGGQDQYDPNMQAPQPLNDQFGGQYGGQYGGNY